MKEIIYDGKSPLTLPSGRVITRSEMEAEAFYRPLTIQTVVLTMTDSGILTSFVPLDNMKDQLGVTETDDEAALAECQRVRSEREEQARKDAVTLEDINEQIAALTSAFAVKEEANNA